MPALIGLREIVIGGGPCLRVKGQPPAVRALMRTCSIDLAGEERPLLLRYHNDPSYSDDDELSISLCLPLDPQARREDFEALAAALLKG
jgi:hypothetical protein